MINLTISKNAFKIRLIHGEAEYDWYSGEFPKESLPLEDEGFSEHASDLFRRDLRHLNFLAYAAEAIIEQWGGELQFNNEKQQWIYCFDFNDAHAWRDRKEMTNEELLKIFENIKKGKSLTIKKLTP